VKQGQGAVLAPKKSEFYAKLQSDPQLGGEGSGFPPRYYIAAGQHNHIVLGIDLGTQYMRVSSLENACIQDVLPATATDLGLHHNGRWMTNHRSRVSPATPLIETVIQAIRTKIGTDWQTEFEGQTVQAEELTNTLFGHLIPLCSGRESKAVRDVVLTVPASFTSMERKLLKACAEDNGLSVMALINEATAAAVGHYCLNPGLANTNYLIFHMGAGTCAATVYTLSNGIVEIKATSSQNNLGGRNFDDVIVQFLIEKFVRKYGRNPHLDLKTLQRFETEAATLKHNLQVSNDAYFSMTNLKVSVPGSNFLQAAGNELASLSGCLSLEQFEELAQAHLDKAVFHAENAIKNAHLTADQINTIFICGGATLMPCLRHRLAEIGGGSTIERLENDMLPSFGAAVQASAITNVVKEFIVWDLLTQPISIVRADGSIMPLLAINTPLPVTAYAKLEIVDNTINACLVQGRLDTLTDTSVANLIGASHDSAHDEITVTPIVINNCPPSTNGDNKVELAVRVSQDGIIQYGARHIGLDVSLLVTPLQDSRKRYQGDLEALINDGTETAKTRSTSSGDRARKLARTLNVPLYFLPQALRGMGFSPEQILQGEAIELALRKIKMDRRARRKQKKIRE